MLNHFELLPFLAGFTIGVVGLFFWKQESRVVMKYPHPSNVNKLVYKDPNGVCYKYTASEVNCDKNEGNLKDYPIQES